MNYSGEKLNNDSYDSESQYSVNDVSAKGENEDGCSVRFSTKNKKNKEHASSTKNITSRHSQIDSSRQTGRDLLAY